jgi:hypothetical protein
MLPQKQAANDDPTSGKKQDLQRTEALNNCNKVAQQATANLVKFFMFSASLYQEPKK